MTVGDDDFDRIPEIEQLLADEDSLLGRYWDYERRNLSPQQMVEEEGTRSNSWVSQYRTLVRVLRDGEIPTVPSAAKRAEQRVTKWLKERQLSDALRASLAAQVELLRSRANDRQAQSAEVGEAVAKTRAVEAIAAAGIYVYTLPHYLTYPYDATTGRTLLKVGHSSRDAIYRVRAQGRLTALPEDPVLLRVYKTAESDKVERTFHDWLRDADHVPPENRRGGSEWFLTSTRFLDRIAQTLDLDVQEVNSLDASGD